MKNGAPRILNEGYSVEATYISSANGAYIEDTEGKTYIDLTLGSGTHILGHNNPVVVEAFTSQVRRGTLYSAPNPIAHEFAETLHKATGLDQFIFCNSGAEATMRVIRIARAFTGKKKVALFSGGWHGSHDLVLAGDDYSTPESSPRTIPLSDARHTLAMKTFVSAIKIVELEVLAGTGLDLIAQKHISI